MRQKPTTLLLVIGLIAIAICLFLDVSHNKHSRMCNNSFLDDVFTRNKHGEGIQRKDVLLNAVVRNDKVPVAIGVPTVYREYKNKTAFYLNRTLESLIKYLTKEQRSQMMVVIFLLDRDVRKRILVHRRIKKQFEIELKSGLFHVVTIQESYYLPLENLVQTFNDSPLRMYWRSKQALDYTYMFHYMHGLCDYYLQIEDDVLAHRDYFTVIMNDITYFNNIQRAHWLTNTLANEPWMLATYYNMGFIGQLMPENYLLLIASVIKASYAQMPVDWSYTVAIEIANRNKVHRRKNLFTHIGKQSSSSGT